MLLLGTDELCAHLSLASARLPDELWATIGQYLSPEQTAITESANQLTIPHKVLVGVGKWAKSQKAADRGKLNRATPARAEVRITQLNVINFAVDYSLANLLSLTDVYAPPLAPKVRVSSATEPSQPFNPRHPPPH